MVLDGNGVRFLDGVEGPQVLRVSSRIGTLPPAHVTSGGKALLAELTPEKIRALYPSGLPGAVSGKAGFDRLFCGTGLRAGYAYNLQQSERGVSAVGDVRA